MGCEFATHIPFFIYANIYIKTLENMYKNFNITEEEKNQIMEMHETNGYKTPINEMFLGKQLSKSTVSDNSSNEETSQPVNESVNILKSNFKRFI